MGGLGFYLKKQGSFAALDPPVKHYFYYLLILILIRNINFNQNIINQELKKEYQG